MSTTTTYYCIHPSSINTRCKYVQFLTDERNMQKKRKEKVLERDGRSTKKRVRLFFFFFFFSFFPGVVCINLCVDVGNE